MSARASARGVRVVGALLAEAASLLSWVLLVLEAWAVLLGVRSSRGRDQCPHGCPARRSPGSGGQGGVARREDRHPGLEPGKVQEQCRGGPAGCHDGKSAPIAQQSVVQIEERANSAGVDKAHATEVDDNRCRALGT